MRSTTVSLILACCLALLLAPLSRAEEERPLPRVEVLDAGREPRRRLRMTPQPGRTQVLEATVRLDQTLTVEGRPVPTQGAPAMRLRLDAACSERRPDGDYVLRFVFREMRLADEQALPSTARDRFHRRMDRFDGTTLVVQCNDRGMARSTAVELPDYFAPDAEPDLQVFKRSFEDWSYPLPEEEVGVGARWRVHDLNDAEGWALEQLTTYELRRLDAEGFEVAIAIEQTAEEQPMPAGRLPPGVTMRLLGCEGRGTGRYVQRFGEPIPRELAMDIGTVLSQRMTRGEETQSSRQDVRLEMLVEGGAPTPTPAPSARTYDPPTAEEALTVIREVLAHVEAGEYAKLGAYLDAEALLGAVFPAHADTMRAAERAELVALFREHFAARSFAFPQLHEGLKGKQIEIGAPEALPPRRDRILVRVLVRHPGGEAEVAWILHRTPSGPRLVDAFTPSGGEVDALRETYEAMSAHTGESPLVWLRRALGVKARPGSAETVPPGEGNPEWASSDALGLGIRPPRLVQAPVDSAYGPLPGSPWLERIALHVTDLGDVFFRPEGRSSHLKRVTFATGSPAEQELALRQVQAMLVDATSRSATRREDGASRHRLLLHADAGCRWQHVAWLARLARDAGVGIRDVDLVVELEDGAFGVVPLPAGAHAAPEAAAVVKLIHRNADNRRTLTRVELPDGATLDLPHVPAAEATAETRAAYGRSLASLRAELVAAGTKRWHVAFPFPYGPRVPYEDVVRLLQMLGDLEVESAAVEPAWLPWEDDPFEREDPEEVEEER